MSNSACLNGGETLFLTTLTRVRLPTGLGAVLEGLDATHVEADRGVELQRLATGRRLGRAEHDADLLAELVDEDRRRAGVVEGTGQLAQRLAHESRLQTDVAVAHLALDLGAGHEGRHRVDDDDVDGPGTDQHVGDLERLLTGVGLRHEQRVGVDAELLRVVRVERVLRVDERRDAARLLRVGDRVEGDRRLARGLRAVDLDDAAARQTADAERDVERDRPGRDHLDGRTDVVAEAHHRALAVALLDLAHHRGEGLVLVLFLHRCHVGHLSAVCVAVVYLRPGPRPRAARSAVGSDARCRRRHRVDHETACGRCGWWRRTCGEHYRTGVRSRARHAGRPRGPASAALRDAPRARPVEGGVRLRRRRARSAPRGPSRAAVQRLCQRPDGHPVRPRRPGSRRPRTRWRGRR